MFRKVFGTIILGAALAACGQPGAPATDAAAPATASVNVIEGVTPEMWSVNGARFADGAFAVERNGTVAVSNPAFPVERGDVYRADITINASSAGPVSLFITNGCGTTDVDQSRIDYSVTAGENTLSVGHAFSRSANCALFTIAPTGGPMTFQLTQAAILRN